METIRNKPLVAFNRWLTEKNYATRTIKSYNQVINNTPEISRYEDLIEHIGYLQKQVKPQTINQRLVSLRLYFNYQKEQGVIKRNIAKNVKVKNVYKPYLEVLKRKELDDLYQNYPSKTKYELRQKILLGLLVYQGADLGTTKNLQSNHIALEKGEIYLPGTNRMNSRNLGLHGSQLMSLYRYLEHRKPEEKLFTVSLKNDYDKLLKQLKTVENIRQIRSSVITNWLNQYNLREVQYYCGHKHIGSTEKYKRVDLESMKRDLKKYHPLG